MSRLDSPLRHRLVFLVGARRSGTNWLGRVVAAHPHVISVPGETHLFSHGIRPLAESIHHGPSGSNRTGSVYMDREAFLDAVRDLCDRIFVDLIDVLDGGGAPGDALLLERTPWHAFALDLITAVYPDAFFVHIVRDGRDVARSLIAQEWGPSQIPDAAREWRSSIEAVRKAMPDIPEDRFAEIRYEDLLADPRTVVTDLYERLGVASDPHVVEDALTEAGVRFNVDPGSPTVEAGKWRAEWSPRDVRRFERVAGPTLAESGYAPSRPLPQARSSGRGVRAKARSALRRGGRGHAERAVLARLNDVQVILDRFFDIVATRRHDDLRNLLTANARVRIVTDDGIWEGRGAEAVGRLGRVLTDDPALAGRQTRGDLHTAIPTSTIVLGYERDGRVEQRTFAISVAGQRITEVTFYSPRHDAVGGAGCSRPHTP